MQKVAQLIDQQFLDQVRIAGGLGGPVVDAAALEGAFDAERLECRRLDELDVLAFIPWPAHVDLTLFTFAG
jgi:hypothetical protein